MSARGWDERLIDAATRVFPQVWPHVEAADPEGRVRPRSAFLCAGLGLLGVACYEGLGGAGREEEVLEAAALLSLLTKVDDQTIDALEFHGGLRALDRAAVRARVAGWLAPTLASIVDARPATREERCALAARLGQRLRRLAGERRDRLEDLLAVIRWGWDVQARAVSAYGAHPERVTLAEVEAVSADISHAWLLMITLVGGVAAEVPRALPPAERAAFAGWGAWMQRADALCDLDKDVLEDGFVSSAAGRLAWERAGAAWLDACERKDAGALFRVVAERDVDLSLLPAPADLDALERRVATGGVGSLLRWVHGLLAWRYARHPACARPGGRPPADTAGWSRFVRSSDGAVPCDRPPRIVHARARGRA